MTPPMRIARKTRTFGLAIATALVVLQLTLLPAASADASINREALRELTTGPSACHNETNGAFCVGQHDPNCVGSWSKNATGNETGHDLYCVSTS